MNNYCDPSSKLYFPLRLLIIFFLGLAIYGQTFTYGFVFDDYTFIVHNPYVWNFKDIHQLWIQYPITRFIGFYSFALNYAIGQLDPRTYHVFNFIVHLISTFLVWGLARMLLKVTGFLVSDQGLREDLAFIIGLIFLVHPGQTQAIAYIAQRFESIAAMFYLATVLCYLKARISTIVIHRNLCFAGAILFSLLGILTKETPATLPMMILAVEWIIIKPRFLGLKKSTDWLISLGAIFLAVLFASLFVKMVRANFDIYLNFKVLSQSHDGDMITSGKYLLTQLRVFLTFLRLLVFPVNQNLDYDYPLSTGLLSPPLTVVGLAVIGFMIFLVIKLRNQRPLISFGLAWILITFSINTAPRMNVIFEHKLYLISFGFILVTVCLLSMLIKDRRLLWGISVVIILLLALTAYHRNHVWQNQMTIWQDVVKKSPYKARALESLGCGYFLEGKYDLALDLLNKSIALNPNESGAYLDRANVYVMKHDIKRAYIEYAKAIILDPKNAQAHLNLGIIYGVNGQLPQAIREMDKTIAIDPHLKAAYINRSLFESRLKLIQSIKK